MDQLNNLSIQEEEAISPLPLSALPDGDPQLVYHSANTTIYKLSDIGYKVLNNWKVRVSIVLSCEFVYSV